MSQQLMDTLLPLSQGMQLNNTQTLYEGAQLEMLKKELEMLRLEHEEVTATNNHLVSATFRERDLKEKLQQVVSQLKESKEIIEKQAIIERQNQLIRDSIKYAKRIQKAIVPSDQMIKRSFQNSGMFYKPKHTLSGDFPWLYTKVTDCYIGAVDCTGHGVPGAMLSMIGTSKLNELVQIGKLDPADLLNLLHSEVQKTLNPNQDSCCQDGMDVAICRVNYAKNELSFAGAHRPMLVLDGNELIEIKGDRRAIGGVARGKRKFEPFVNHTLPLKKGMRVFMYSDGLPDQLNEDDSNKFSNRQIKEIVMEQRNNSVSDTITTIKTAFHNWKGKASQLDDVLLIGFEL